MIENQGYSDIGFRSETSFQELRKYSKRENPNPLALEDAKKIVNTFYEIIAEKEKYNLGRGNNKYYFKLIMEDILGKERIISSIPVLTTTKTTLEKIANNETNISPKEIETTIDFFKKISSRCKEHCSTGSF